MLRASRNRFIFTNCVHSQFAEFYAPFVPKTHGNISSARSNAGALKRHDQMITGPHRLWDKACLCGNAAGQVLFSLLHHVPRPARASFEYLDHPRKCDTKRSRYVEKAEHGFYALKDMCNQRMSSGASCGSSINWATGSGSCINFRMRGAAWTSSVIGSPPAVILRQQFGAISLFLKRPGIVEG